MIITSTKSHGVWIGAVVKYSNNLWIISAVSEHHITIISCNRANTQISFSNGFPYVNHFKVKMEFVADCMADYLRRKIVEPFREIL